MKNWRPKNWWKTHNLNPYRGNGTKEDIERELAHKAWYEGHEAGADAMLKNVIYELNQAQDEKELRMRMNNLVKSILSHRIFREASNDKRR